MFSLVNSFSFPAALEITVNPEHLTPLILKEEVESVTLLLLIRYSTETGAGLHFFLCMFVKLIIGTWDCFRSSSQTAKPSILGSITSSSTKSNCAAENVESASTPSLAKTMSYPASCRKFFNNS